jgi:hypothetical protein
MVASFVTASILCKCPTDSRLECQTRVAASLQGMMDDTSIGAVSVARHEDPVQDRQKMTRCAAVPRGRPATPAAPGRRRTKSLQPPARVQAISKGPQVVTSRDEISCLTRWKFLFSVLRDPAPILSSLGPVTNERAPGRSVGRSVSLSSRDSRSLLQGLAAETQEQSRGAEGLGKKTPRASSRFSALPSNLAVHHGNLRGTRRQRNVDDGDSFPPLLPFSLVPRAHKIVSADGFRDEGAHEIGSRFFNCSACSQNLGKTRRNAWATKGKASDEKEEVRSDASTRGFFMAGWSRSPRPRPPPAQ